MNYKTNNITIVSTPYKELPSETMGAVEKVSMERAIALYNSGFNAIFVSPTNGDNIGVPIFRIKKLEINKISAKESKIRWLFDTKSFSYFQPYLDIPKDVIGEFTILDGVRIDPWNFLVMKNKFKKSKIINVMHFPGPLFNSIYIKPLSFIYKSSIWGTLSRGMYAFMKKLGYKTVYFPNGIDIPEKNCIETNPERYILFFGRIEEFKAPHLAILLSKKTGIPLKICGRIYDYNYFNKYIKKYIDGKMIEFLGEIPYKKLFDILKKALAVVYFGEHYDPQPTVLMESISYGVPVIGFNLSPLSGFHDIIKNGKNGIVISKNLDTNNIEKRLYKFDRMDIYNKTKLNWSWSSVINNYYKLVFEEILSESFS